MAIFNSYVSLPEGISSAETSSMFPVTPIGPKSAASDLFSEL